MLHPELRILRAKSDGQSGDSEGQKAVGRKQTAGAGKQISDCGVEFSSEERVGMSRT